MRSVAAGSSLTPSPRRRRGPSPLVVREWLTAYGFLTPQLIGLLVFTLGPLAVTVYYSFIHWDLVAPARWVGLENWRYFFGDPRVGAVVLNTLKFILMGTTSFLVLSLGLALLVNKPRRGIGLFRALYFMPWVLSALAVGTAWRWMFNTQSGPFAQVFGLFGGQSPDWLLDANFAMMAIAIMTTWQGLGYGLTVFLAGLQGVPHHLHEAAQMDGANGWKRFRYITLPLLSPTILFLTVTSLIGAFQLFDPVVAMTSSAATISAAGGPDNSTRTIVLYLYNQLFTYTEKISGVGYGAVIAWMLALVIFAVTAVQLVVARWFVFYGE